MNSDYSDLNKFCELNMEEKQRTTTVLVYTCFLSSSPVTVSLKVEPQLEDPIGELAAEAMTV